MCLKQIDNWVPCKMQSAQGMNCFGKTEHSKVHFKNKWVYCELCQVPPSFAWSFENILYIYIYIYIGLIRWMQAPVTSIDCEKKASEVLQHRRRIRGIQFLECSCHSLAHGTTLQLRLS